MSRRGEREVVQVLKGQKSRLEVVDIQDQKAGPRMPFQLSISSTRLHRQLPLMLPRNRLTKVEFGLPYPVWHETMRLWNVRANFQGQIDGRSSNQFPWLRVK
jgi:hypothetical protein